MDLDLAEEQQMVIDMAKAMDEAIAKATQEKTNKIAALEAKNNQKVGNDKN